MLKLVRDLILTRIYLSRALVKAMFHVHIFVQSVHVVNQHSIENAGLIKFREWYE